MGEGVGGGGEVGVGVGVGVVDEGGGLETVFGGKDISWGRGEGGGGVRDITSYIIKNLRIIQDSLEYDYMTVGI